MPFGFENPNTGHCRVTVKGFGYLLHQVWESGRRDILASNWAICTPAMFETWRICEAAPVSVKILRALEPYLVVATLPLNLTMLPPEKV